jgi:ubiquinone/menaquinone biosynthesis C-methylase UbiE
MTSIERVRHPLFARIYQRVSAAAEAAGAAAHRTRLLAGLTGRVVEVGAGNGMNFVHYPDTVAEVIAIEPEAYLRSRAVEAAARAAVPIRVVDGTAASLPLDDAAVDAGVASLVLCSVADQTRALAELHRVIRPDGELRFYEHVAAGNPKVAAWQRRVDPIWTRLAGGCHLTRDTAAAVASAGFVIEESERFLFQPCWMSKLSAEHVIGRARRTDRPRPLRSPGR